MRRQRHGETVHAPAQVRTTARIVLTEHARRYRYRQAIVDEQGGGPQFGPEGLKVNVDARSARSRLGTYYARRPDGGRYLFSADEAGAAELTALRAYVGIGTTSKAESYKPSLLQWQPGELEKLREQDRANGQ